jgi:hypothetical protein
MELTMHLPTGFEHAVVWPDIYSLAEELAIENWLDTHVGIYQIHWMYSWECVCFVNADHAIEFSLTWG